MKNIRKPSVDEALQVLRPVLGDKIPVTFWRILRVIAMPEVFGENTFDINRAIGMEMSKTLNVKVPEDIVKEIRRLRIGVCHPLEKTDDSYAIEFTECLTCSGITPAVGAAMCDLEAGIVEGAFKELGINVEKAQETKCIGGLGDDVCRIEVKVV
jgi:predicted hydrocarbon binding protein